MATYNANYTTMSTTGGNAVNNLLTSIYDQRVQDQLSVGSIFQTTESTMPWRQESQMNIKPNSVKVKAGYLAQVYNESTIVWESKKAYKTHDKAMAVAKAKISSSIDKLFNK